ncbi:MAG: hypothetical protein QNK40_03890 [Desulfobacterales bacterium]|nr:hypothetical protein [Desulfobacterales bacterium]
MSRKLIGGKDIPFRPLPEGYSYTVIGVSSVIVKWLAIKHLLMSR